MNIKPEGDVSGGLESKEMMIWMGLDKIKYV